MPKQRNIHNNCRSSWAESRLSVFILKSTTLQNTGFQFKLHEAASTNCSDGKRKKKDENESLSREIVSTERQTVQLKLIKLQSKTWSNDLRKLKAEIEKTSFQHDERLPGPPQHLDSDSICWFVLYVRLWTSRPRLSTEKSSCSLLLFVHCSFIQHQCLSRRLLSVVVNLQECSVQFVQKQTKKQIFKSHCDMKEEQKALFSYHVSL